MKRPSLYQDAISLLRDDETGQQEIGYQINKPQRKPELVSDYLWPLLTSGTVSFLGALLIVWQANLWTLPHKLSSLRLWFSYFLVFWVVTYVLYLFQVWRFLITRLEEWTNIDINRDGVTGRGEHLVTLNARRRGVPAGRVAVQPGPVEPEMSLVEAETEDDELPIWRARLPMEAEIAWFVRGIGETEASDLRYWLVQGMTRTRWQEYRDKLIACNWADWNVYDEDGQAARTQGWHLTADAEEICNSIRTKVRGGGRW